MADQDQRPMQGATFEEWINLSRVLRTTFHITICALAIISVNLYLGKDDKVGGATKSVFLLLAVTLILYGILRMGHYRIAGLGLLASVSAVMFYNFYIAGGIHDNAMVIFPVLIMFAGLLLGKRTVAAMTILVLAEISVLYWFTIRGVITPYEGRTHVDLQDFITIVILILVSGILIWLTMNIIEKNILQTLESEKQLRHAYDQTIDGWGRALELFDEETEGHSLRVTNLTMEIARRLHMDEEDLEHIRRGTLLHDIGKMGIADEILNKPGPLTDEERKVIQQHPWQTYRLLKNIPFLVKALEIPFCHHERWDGTGYPRKLMGEEIPLPARIFSIVDNWDALTSDRPYRKAWPRDKVIEHLRKESGRMFDPGLVELVIQVIKEMDGEGLEAI
jgi:putative nucleotidyltransferase with HDIG domain